MDRSEQLNELAPALAKAQAEIRGAREDSLNPHLKSKYADLTSVWDACREALTTNGLSVAQFAEPAPEGSLALTTMLLHASGQFLSGTIVMPLAKADPQGYGAALTYARRYGLSAMVGVCPADDDDGHSASQRPQSNSAGYRPAQEERFANPSGPMLTGRSVPPPQAESSGDRGALLPNGSPREQVASGAFDTSPPEGTKGQPGSLACSVAECGKILTQGQYDVSRRGFGQPLCPACQKARREAAPR